MAGSGFDLSEGFRRVVEGIGERLVEVDKRCKAYFGLLPNAGVVRADDAGNYTANDQRAGREIVGPETM
jgi:hypothetical protein